jgi:hypothetical protein
VASLMVQRKTAVSGDEAYLSETHFQNPISSLFKCDWTFVFLSMLNTCSCHCVQNHIRICFGEHLVVAYSKTCITYLGEQLSSVWG